MNYLDLDIPERRGIYLFLLPNLKVGYVGSSVNLRKRYLQHVNGSDNGNKLIFKEILKGNTLDYMILEYLDNYSVRDIKTIESNWMRHFRHKGLNLINISEPKEEFSYSEPRPVIAYCIETLTFKGEWSSLYSASKELKCSLSALFNALNEKPSRKNRITPLLTNKKLFWFYKEDFSFDKLTYKKQRYLKSLLEKSKAQSEAGKLNTIKINQYTKNYKLLKIWQSAKDAERALNISRSSICHCLKGKQKSAGGYIWKYAEESEIENESLCFQNF